MNKSEIIGLCMLTSALSGFTAGYFADTYAPLPSKNTAVKVEVKPNRLLNGLVGGLCALVGGTSTVVMLNRRYGDQFEEYQNSYR